MKLSLWSLSAVAVAFALSGFAFAGSPSRNASSTPKADVAEVDVFDAMESGDIEVRVIPKDSTGGNILVRNKTGKPLKIKLPAAFAAAPVARQFGGMGGGGMGGMGGGGMGGGGGQMMGGGGMGGGGMGGMGGGMGGMGGGGMGGGGGFFNVAPEKVTKIKFAGVCLEHGKPEPSPRMAYELRRIEEVTSNPQVIEVVSMVGTGKIDQRAGQAAAWHLTDEMSWQELANKIGAKHLDGSTEPFFTPGQMELAMNISREAARRAEGKEVPKSNYKVPSVADQQ